MPLCSYRVFLCHASDERDLAAELSASLEGQGHEVFLDADDLPGGATYVDRIANAIRRAHLFVFLVSPNSVAEGRYTLSELELARKRWKRATGKVLPVMAAETPIGDLPAYLSALTLLKPKGNLVAEVTHAAAKLRRRRCRRFLVSAVTVLLAAALIGGLGWATLVHRQEAGEATPRDKSSQILPDSPIKVIDTSVDCYRPDFQCEVLFTVGNLRSRDLLLQRFVMEVATVNDQTVLGDFLTPTAVADIDLTGMIRPGSRGEKELGPYRLRSGEVDILAFTFAADLPPATFRSWAVRGWLVTSEGSVELEQFELRLPWDRRRGKSAPITMPE